MHTFLISFVSSSLNHDPRLTRPRAENRGALDSEFVLLQSAGKFVGCRFCLNVNIYGSQCPNQLFKANMDL
jgi:hypothetical protein